VERLHTYSSNVIPAKRSFVDLSESEPSSLGGINNMPVVIVEIVKGGVPAGRPAQLSVPKCSSGRVTIAYLWTMRDIAT
jgi:hypothetical protein